MPPTDVQDQEIRPLLAQFGVGQSEAHPAAPRVAGEALIAALRAPSAVIACADVDTRRLVVLPRAAPASGDNVDAVMLWYAAQGRACKWIARELGVSESTVSRRLRHVFEDLGFASRCQLVSWVRRLLDGGPGRT